MVKICIEDHAIWISSLKGDPVLQSRLLALGEGEKITLEVGGLTGVWEKMRDGKDGRKTFGIKPTGIAADHWKVLQALRGNQVELREGGPTSYLDALHPLLEVWDSPEDELAFAHLSLGVPPVILQFQSVADLLRLHADVLDELRARQILRSGNGPAGDYAENLFARAFGWALEHNSQSGHDAVDAFGTRFQIKCRRVTKQNPSRQLSSIRNLGVKPFDVLAGVILDQNFRVVRAALVPFTIVEQEAKFVEHVNAWRLILRDKVWSLPGVEDVTAKLKNAEDSSAPPSHLTR